eukprot:Nitzschia sp. Nitz4//scaffold62_size106224//104308//105701//NITZ4_004376-RA/size106224-augustus-gene-0.107-mRNA-1//-1//CDS//3329555916//1586//frame0
MGIADRLKSLDNHSTVSKEFRVYTAQGAALSVVTILAILYLVYAEVDYNFRTITTERVHVNATSPVGLDVEFDISFPSVPCSLLNIDANDPAGQTQSLHLDKRHHIWKHRIKVNEQNGNILFLGKKKKLEQGSTLLEEGHLKAELESLLASKEDGDDEPVEVECGSCYGAGDEGECCQTCDDVKRAYNRKGWHLTDVESVEQCKGEQAKNSKEEDGEGCNVHGLVALDSGGGNFHLAPGRDSSQMVETGQVSNIFDLLMKTFDQWNVSHTVHKIRFGEEYPGHVHQLDEQSRNVGDTYGMYQYYFKIVPTRYQFLNGTTIETNQFSVTEHLRHVNPGSGRGLPGVFMFYEISPLHVEIVEGYRKGWIAFFTSVCAIVGGVVTTMGMLDQFLYSLKSGPKAGGLLR